MLGFWTSRGQPNSLEQMGCLASLSSFLGRSLFASGWMIGAHLSSRQSALTSFPAGQQDVFYVSRLSTEHGSVLSMADFFLQPCAGTWVWPGVQEARGLDFVSLEGPSLQKPLQLPVLLA